MSNIHILPMTKEAKADIITQLKELVDKLETGELETTTLTCVGDTFAVHLGDVNDDMYNRNAVFNLSLGLQRFLKHI